MKPENIIHPEKMENITEKKEEQKYVPCVHPVIYQYQREVKQKYVHQGNRIGSGPQYVDYGCQQKSAR